MTSCGFVGVLRFYDRHTEDIGNDLRPERTLRSAARQNQPFDRPQSATFHLIVAVAHHQAGCFHARSREHAGRKLLPVEAQQRSERIWLTEDPFTQVERQCHDAMATGRNGSGFIGQPTSKFVEALFFWPEWTEEFHHLIEYDRAAGDTGH